MKPDIFLVSNSSLLGPIYSHDSPGYVEGVNIGPPNGWQKPAGYNIQPPSFDADMAGSGLADWSAGGKVVGLLDDTTAKMFIVSGLVSSDIINDSYSGDFAALIAAELQFISDILITSKGALAKNILYHTGYVINALKYGEYDSTDSNYKSAIESHVNHNIAICMKNLIPGLSFLGVFVADTFFDVLDSYPSMRAFTDQYLVFDGVPATSSIHMSTKTGSRYGDKFLKPYFRRWLADPVRF